MPQRNLAALAERRHDLVIVGGGIFGACAAWDAALRGLSVALVESGDFGHATSANHFKIVHGGIRYLQHADFFRVRESNRARNALLRVAPHLVRPLPVMVPTYGHGMRGKEILAAGMFLYNLIVFDRNRGLRDPARTLPWGRLLSRRESLDLAPGLEEKGLTGGVVFYDGQIHNPPRLVISIMRSAVQAGACIANYLHAARFSRKQNHIEAVEVHDNLTGERLTVRGRMFLNAAGPWAEGLLRDCLDLNLNPPLTYSRDAYFVVRRRLVQDCAIALPARTKDPDAIVHRGNRHLFISPWRDYTLVGVWHAIHDREPESFTVTDEELERFINEINEITPAFSLKMEDVSMWNAGIVLFGKNQPGATDLSYGHRSLLVDHESVHGINNLATLIGVRATTAMDLARKAIDLICAKLARKHAASEKWSVRVYGGDIESFDDFLHEVTEARPPSLSADAMAGLAHNYGKGYHGVLKYLDENRSWSETIGCSKVIKAEVIHAVREEMAVKLGDVLFRRTDLGTGGHPGEAALRTCAQLMARELKWSEPRVEAEVNEVTKYLHARSPQSAAFVKRPTEWDYWRRPQVPGT